MIGSSKQIGKFITAFLLFIAFMLPSTIQFIHSLEEHEEIVCNENATHVHELIVECDICDFNLANLNYQIASFPDLQLSIIPVKVNSPFISLGFTPYILTNTQLRAPPAYS